ncbi:hypothetical protein ACWEOZ_38805, partial [Actinoplanes sp. NPDC004185]
MIRRVGLVAAIASTFLLLPADLAAAAGSADRRPAPVTPSTAPVTPSTAHGAPPGPASAGPAARGPSSAGPARAARAEAAQRTEAAAAKARAVRDPAGAGSPGQCGLAGPD